MLGIMNLSKTTKYRTLKKSIYNLIISYKSVFSKTLESNGSILVVVLVVVFFIKKIILFKIWSHISYFQAVRKCTASLKDLLIQSTNTENGNSHSYKIFVGTSPSTDFLLLQSLITCFTSFIKTGWNKNLLVILKFFLIVLMLGWLSNLMKMLFIPLSLVYDEGTLVESSVNTCRSSWRYIFWLFERSWCDFFSSCNLSNYADDNTFWFLNRRAKP